MTRCTWFDVLSLVSLVSIVEQVDVSALPGELLIVLLPPFRFVFDFRFLNSLVTSVFFVCFAAINVLHGMSVLVGLTGGKPSGVFEQSSLVIDH